MNISCTKLQLPPEPLTKGLQPPDPRYLCPLSSTEFVEHPRKKFLGTPLTPTILCQICLVLPSPDRQMAETRLEINRR